MTFRLPSDLRYKGPKFLLSGLGDLSLGVFQPPPSGLDLVAYLSTSGAQLWSPATPIYLSRDLHRLLLGHV